MSDDPTRPQPQPGRHAENFSMADFMLPTGDTLAERLAPFAQFARDQMTSGERLYMREVVGPAGPRALVKDHLTGTVRPMLMFGSNNYLGLADHPHVRERVQAVMREFGTGLGGPPLLNGMTSLHRALEERLAALKGCENALLFPSGYQANLGILDGLVRPGDVVVYDEYSHASFYDGLKLVAGKGRLRTLRFKHNDLTHLKTLLDQLERPSGCQVFIGVEGVYSMDGDLVDLPAVVDLADRYAATLLLDDAHGTGVLGARGTGTSEHFGVSGVDVVMGTFSKAFAASGAFVAGSRDVVDYLRFFARPYMFSAHMPPVAVAAVLGALDVLEAEPERCARLRANAATLSGKLLDLGLDVISGAAISVVRVPERVDMKRIAKRLHEEGLFLNAIEYPAVAPSEQRLRISVMATHEARDLDEAAAILGEVCAEFGVGGARGG